MLCIHLNMEYDIFSEFVILGETYSEYIYLTFLDDIVSNFVLMADLEMPII